MEPIGMRITAYHHMRRSGLRCKIWMTIGRRRRPKRMLKFFCRISHTMNPSDKMNPKKSPISMQPLLYVIAIAIVLILIAAPLTADTIILRNGAEVDGQIVGQSQTTVTIRTDAGVETYPKANIRQILYGD